MAENDSILVAVRAQSFEGERLMGNKWAHFIHTFRGLLKQNGVEESGSVEELLLFQYSHPFSAFASVFEGLEKAKKKQGWKPSQGQVPIQLVFHLPQKGEPPTPLREVTSEIWSVLKKETPYVSRSLKQKWDLLMAGKKLPPHSFEKEGDGLFLLKLSQGSLGKAEKLFPLRDLAVRGKLPECFYCGMTSHEPALCPSKLLSGEMHGIDEVGYLPFAKMSAAYKKVFSNQEKAVNLLAAGVDMAKIRKSPELLIYVAYFDMFKIYQPRFLRDITFTTKAKWVSAISSESLHIDNKNMHMGLDCLRVGQYAQAQEFFNAESVKREGKQFHAVIGQAFLALETGRVQDMGRFLDRAHSLASLEKDRIYNGLLLSRYYELLGDIWKTKDVVKSILNIKPDCEEAQYRMIQLEVKDGYNEMAFKQLQTLAVERKDFFIMALMDPLLLPVHGFIEEVLTAKIQVVAKNANEKLVEAISECNELRSWFDEGNEKMDANFKMLADLEKQYKRKSYFDILDVITRGQNLIYSCKQLRDEGLDALDEKISELAGSYEKHLSFWNNYEYSFLFNKFQVGLGGIKQELLRARRLIKIASGEGYRKALELVDAAERDVKKLNKKIDRMLWVKMVLDGLKLFGKKLLIAEAVLVVLAVLLFPVLSSVLPGTPAAGLVTLLKNASFQKQTILVIVLLLAPFVAFSLTIWDLRETE